MKNDKENQQKNNNFESRFSSQKPEDIAWRENVAWVDAAIEGIERNSKLAKLSKDMSAKGFSIEEQIKHIIAFDLNSDN